MENINFDLLIDSLSDGSKISDATLIALKKLNESKKHWLKALTPVCNCHLCGMKVLKNEITIFMESSPVVEHVDRSTVSASRFAFLACKLCAELLISREGDTVGWDAQGILSWQKEFLISSGYTDCTVSKLTCGKAKEKIILVETCND